MLQSLKRWHLFGGIAAYSLMFVLVWVLQVRDGYRLSLKVMGSFWAAGKAAWDGANPYLHLPLTWLVFTPKTVLIDLNLNPPALLPLFQLFALGDPYTVTRLWMILSTALYLGGVALLIRKYDATPIQVLLASIFPGFLNSIFLAQIYTLMFALAAGSWLAMRGNRDILAGALLGALIAIKPNFGLVIPIAFLAGHRSIAYAATGSAAALSVFPVLLYGPEIYAQWFSAAANDDHWIFPTDVSLMGYFRRLDLQPVGVALAGTIIAAACWLAWRKRPSAPQSAALAMAAGILCSPLAWYHYSIVLVPWFLDHRWSKRDMAAAAILLVPVQVVLLGLQVAKPLFSAIYPIGLLILLWSLKPEVRREAVA